MTRFTTRSLAVAAALLTSLVAPHATASARDYSFRPFTDLGSVCPTCPPPAGDVVALKSGQKLHGTVIAVNSAFYTLARFGEVRTIGRGEVAKVTWLRGSQPSGIDKLDQIIFKNGDVLTGRITRSDETGTTLRSTTPDQTFFVARPLTAAVFKEGVEAR